MEEHVWLYFKKPGCVPSREIERSISAYHSPFHIKMGYDIYMISEEILPFEEMF
ncbi:MAG: hypothetical protein ACTSQS_06270 [Promethearchaeota archaeon]